MRILLPLLFQAFLGTALLSQTEAVSLVAPDAYAKPGDLVASSVMEEWPLEKIKLLEWVKQNKVAGQIKNGVKTFKIEYLTERHQKLTLASAKVTVPLEVKGALPLISCQHGTLINNEDAPSNATGFPDIFTYTPSACRGFVVVEPDYLGYGSSTQEFHPYMIANSYGPVVTDAVRAVRHFCQEQKIPLSGQFFMDGYSEGGYATLAALQHIEKHHPEEIQPTGVAAGSGPYDLIRSLDFMTDVKSGYHGKYNAVFTAFFLAAYHKEYGGSVSLSELMQKPYPDQVCHLFLFNEAKKGEKILAALPGSNKDLLCQEFIQYWQTGGQSKLRRLLSNNSMHDWKPQTPVMLYYMTEDSTVPPINSENAFKNFTAKGAKVEKVSAKGDHGDYLPLFFEKVQPWLEHFLGRN